MINGGVTFFFTEKNPTFRRRHFRNSLYARDSVPRPTNSYDEWNLGLGLQNATGFDYTMRESRDYLSRVDLRICNNFSFLSLYIDRSRDRKRERENARRYIRSIKSGTSRREREKEENARRKEWTDFEPCIQIAHSSYGVFTFFQTRKTYRARRIEARRIDAAR